MLKSIYDFDITSYHFAKNEVLPDEQSRLTRLHDLYSAQAATNMEHDEVGLIVQLESGEEVEVLSNLITVGRIHVEVKGGHLIPITAILRVEV